MKWQYGESRQTGRAYDGLAEIFSFQNGTWHEDSKMMALTSSMALNSGERYLTPRVQVNRSKGPNMDS